MTNFDNYISVVNLSDPGLGDAIQSSIVDFSNKYLDTFNYTEKSFGLLHGQVQSGKTAQALGIIAQASDKGFKVFLYLTTDNISLQQQTLGRATNYLPMFNVYSETDDTKLFKNKLDKVIVIVLKKNQRVLSSWLNYLTKSGFVSKCPMMIIDDEADAASLNTKINQNNQSKINQLLEDIFSIPPSGLYLQVTATPQALLLQSKSTGWKPKFAFTFNPGQNYLGGKKLYTVDSKIQKTIDDQDVTLLLNSPYVPESLRKAVYIFLVASVQLENEGKNVCNMLIHPSHKIKDHEKVSTKLLAFINDLKLDYIKQSISLRENVFYAWNDLKQTYLQMDPFDAIWEKFGKIIVNVRVLVLNSNVEKSGNGEFIQGTNILIGGNVLGRGLTIKGLQNVYYTRQAKAPLADTIWQHQRIFGYDRVYGLCRISATGQLFKMFRELSEASQVIFDGVSKGSLEEIPIMLPGNMRPTRQNVVIKDDQLVLAGGVNYFPSEPSGNNTAILDKKLGTGSKDEIISLDAALEIIKMQEVEDDIDWDKNSFIGAVNALILRKTSQKCLLIIRTDRSISKGTGTLLSPNDRALGDNNPDKLVLTMYRLTGEKEKGWNGKPLWVPNIKLPDGKVFYSVSE